MSARRRILGFGLAGLILALDQATKAAVLNSPTLAFGGVIELRPNLDFIPTRNTGVSFGLLSDLPIWAVAGLTGLIAAAFGAWLWRARDVLAAAGLGLVLGGAGSNIVDRLRHGAVTDFIDAHWGELRWPAFNAADAAIMIGAAILLSSSLLLRRTQQERTGSTQRAVG